MKFTTTRFGTLEVSCDELFLFPGGLIGLEKRRQWALLPDPDQPTLAWLQSTTRGELALPMISPRAFVPEYRAKIAGRDLSFLRLRPDTETFLLTTVTIGDGAGGDRVATTNLRAPIVLNIAAKLGGQVVTTDDQPIRHPLPSFAGSGSIRHAA